MVRYGVGVLLQKCLVTYGLTYAPMLRYVQNTSNYYSNCYSSKSKEVLSCKFTLIFLLLFFPKVVQTIFSCLVLVSGFANWGDPGRKEEGEWREPSSVSRRSTPSCGTASSSQQEETAATGKKLHYFDEQWSILFFFLRFFLA